MVFCSSCDGVPLKFKKKNGQASSLPARIIEHSIDPLRIRWTIPLNPLTYFLLYLSRNFTPHTDMIGVTYVLTTQPFNALSAFLAENSRTFCPPVQFEQGCHVAPPPPTRGSGHRQAHGRGVPGRISIGAKARVYVALVG
jgi:hypothetical protein